jgi:hypothetical protein
MKLFPETIEQIKLCDWLLAKTNLPFYHFPLEGKRSLANASILKRMGMKSGVSDLFIPRKYGIYSGLWLELKVGKNKPTPMQTAFLDKMIAEGYMAVCVWGSDAAIEFIKTFYEIN